MRTPPINMHKEACRRRADAAQLEEGRPAARLSDSEVSDAEAGGPTW